MMDINTLLAIKKALHNFSGEYAQIVSTFEQSTMNTELMDEANKMRIRMDALELRCKNSQFLLEKIITLLETKHKDSPQIERYKNQVSGILNGIRDELHKNNLHAMIKRLEEIPVIMSAISNEINATIEQTSTTRH